MTPQSSQTPRTAESEEAEHRDDVQPENVRAGLREDADQARPDQPAGDDSAITSRLNSASSFVHQVVEPLVHEADLDLAVAHLLERVVDLVRQLRRHLREPPALAPRARARSAAA